MFIGNGEVVIFIETLFDLYSGSGFGVELYKWLWDTIMFVLIFVFLFFSQLLETHLTLT